MGEPIKVKADLSAVSITESAEFKAAVAKAASEAATAAGIAPSFNMLEGLG